MNFHSVTDPIPVKRSLVLWPLIFRFSWLVVRDPVQRKIRLCRVAGQALEAGYAAVAVPEVSQPARNTPLTC